VRQAGEALDRGVERMLSLPAYEPGQAFDNLYFLGTEGVSAWVVKTSAGLILIDALNDEREARDVVEAGMRKLGLDPAQVRYIVVTHAHGDHYGGVAALAAKYKARVVASEADWQQMEGKLEFASRLWPAPPKRDIAVKDGDTVTLGDTTLTLYVTPGHTLGTLSPVIPVRHNGVAHQALLWGGTAFNFGKDMPRLDGYRAATERMRAVSAQRGVDVLISNHSSYDQAPAKLRTLAAQGRSGANAFVIGGAAVDRSLDVMGTCALAQRERFAAS
jgi:metallo-beta-lactamase class B